MFKLINTNNMLSILHSHVLAYSTPYNLSYFWSVGALAGLIMALQIVTGIELTMHYTSDVIYCFSDIQSLSKDVGFGWYLRSIHANGASLFFLLLYIHILKAFFYSSFLTPRTLTWSFGILVFILSMAIAFIGYVLPWGQMSLWGATVITNLFKVIPFIGAPFLDWLWGDYGISQPLLNRFFALHFFLPWVLAALVFCHLIFLHQTGSSNPIGINKNSLIAFLPGFGVKDIYMFFFAIIFLAIVLSLFPDYFGHPDNSIEANPLVTPEHIVPEWYFLPFYAILRSVPNKTGGVAMMALSLVLLLFLPYFPRAHITRSPIFRPIYILFLFFFVVDMFFLGWLGQSAVESPYVSWGLFCSLYYFIFLLVILPGMPVLELYLNNLRRK